MLLTFEGFLPLLFPPWRTIFSLHFLWSYDLACDENLFPSRVRLSQLAPCDWTCMVHACVNKHEWASEGDVGVEGERGLRHMHASLIKGLARRRRRRGNTTLDND
jgi:hypothetical protein